MRLFANIAIFIILELFLAALGLCWWADLPMRYYLSAIGGIFLTILLFTYVNETEEE